MNTYNKLELAEDIGITLAVVSLFASNNENLYVLLVSFFGLCVIGIFVLIVIKIILRIKRKNKINILELLEDMCFVVGIWCSILPTLASAFYRLCTTYAVIFIMDKLRGTAFPSLIFTIGRICSISTIIFMVSKNTLRIKQINKRK